MSWPHTTTPSTAPPSSRLRSLAAPAALGVFLSSSVGFGVAAVAQSDELCYRDAGSFQAQTIDAPSCYFSEECWEPEQQLSVTPNELTSGSAREYTIEDSPEDGPSDVICMSAPSVEKRVASSETVVLDDEESSDEEDEQEVTVLEVVYTITVSNGSRATAWYSGGTLVDLGVFHGQPGGPPAGVAWRWLERPDCGEGPSIEQVSLVEEQEWIPGNTPDPVCIPRLAPGEGPVVFQIGFRVDADCGFTNHVGITGSSRQKAWNLQAFGDVSQNSQLFRDSASASLRCSGPPPPPTPPVPSIDLVMSATPSPASVGEVVTFTSTVTNDGEVSLTDIELVNRLGNGGDGGDGGLGSFSTFSTSNYAPSVVTRTLIDALDGVVLAPGESVTASTTHTVTEADLDGPLAAGATATGSDGVATVSDSATVVVDLLAPAPAPAPPAPAPAPAPEPEPDPEPEPAPEPTAEVLGESIEREPAPTPAPAVAQEELTATGHADARGLATAMLLLALGSLIVAASTDPRRRFSSVR